MIEAFHLFSPLNNFHKEIEIEYTNICTTCVFSTVLRRNLTKCWRIQLLSLKLHLRPFLHHMWLLKICKRLSDYILDTWFSKVKLKWCSVELVAVRPFTYFVDFSSGSELFSSQFLIELGPDRSETCTAQRVHASYPPCGHELVCLSPLTICLPHHLVTKTRAPNMKTCGHQATVGGDVSSGKILGKLFAQNQSEPRIDCDWPMRGLCFDQDVPSDHHLLLIWSQSLLWQLPPTSESHSSNICCLYIKVQSRVQYI